MAPQTAHDEPWSEPPPQAASRPPTRHTAASRHRKSPRTRRGRDASEHARRDRAPLGEGALQHAAHHRAQLQENANIDPNHVARVHEQRALGLPADAEQWLTGPLSETKARKSGACSRRRKRAALRRGESEEKGRCKDVMGSATYLPLDDGRPRGWKKRGFKRLRGACPVESMQVFSSS